MAEAAPGPVFGLEHETARDRVAMHISQLLDELVLCQDVEVVVTGLPEVLLVGLEEFGRLALSARMVLGSD